MTRLAPDLHCLTHGQTAKRLKLQTVTKQNIISFLPSLYTKVYWVRSEITGKGWRYDARRS